MAVKKLLPEEAPKPSFVFSLRVPAPFDFRLTVRKPAGWHWAVPTELFEKDTLFTAARLTNQRLIGLKLRGGRTVEVAAYSKRTLDEAEKTELIDRVRLGLGLDEDIEGFYALAEKDSLIETLKNDLYGMRVGLAGDVFERALLAICLQMVPMQRSNQMMGCLIEKYGENVTADGRLVRYWPAAGRLAAVDPEDMGRACKLGYRAKFINQTAAVLAAGFPDILELKAMSPQAALARLRTLPGIGPYSAQIVSPHMGFPLDIWSARIFHEVMFGSTPKEPRKVIAKVEEAAKRRWGNYLWHVFVYLLHDLPALSKRYKITKLV
jgi:3-methyladenine DNA glycosylase/8-oxoguanine DNA glycosylase